MGINLKLSENFVKADDEPFSGSIAPIVDLGTYVFKDLNTGKFTTEESFTNDYVE